MDKMDKKISEGSYGFVYASPDSLLAIKEMQIIVVSVHAPLQLVCAHAWAPMLMPC